MSSKSRKPVRRSREQWQRLINNQLEGDDTQAEYCQQHGIAVSSFCHWKRRLSQEPASNQSAEDNTWLSLPEQLFSTSNNWRIELDLGGGVCLRFSQN